MDKALKIAHSVEETPKTKNLVLDIKLYLKNNYDLRFNVISRNIENKGKAVNDNQLNSIYVACKTRFPKTSKDLVKSIMFSDFIEDFNPFHDIIERIGKRKVGTKFGHINDIIDSIDTDTANSNIFIRKWLIAIIASYHGYHSPLMLVLCGGQNTGKTYWFRNFLPKELHKYYAESKLDAGKDDEILMTKKLIIMDDEMGGKSKQEQKKLKEMTSKQTFSIRAPYGHVSEDLERIAMLCGTTNDEEILNDPTGNRRILPVRVLTIDREKYNKVDKELLFQECYLLYKQGESYELNDAEIQTLKESSVEFKQAIPEEELVSKYYGLPDDYQGHVCYDRTNSEILSYIYGLTNTKLSPTKLGIVLKSMGFKQESKKVNGVTIRAYSVVEKTNLVAVQDEKKAPF